MLNPPKAHTRATAMANDHVNNNTLKKVTEDQENAKNLFKMKKFAHVQGRMSSQNPGYKPKFRGMSACRTVSRPLPI